MVLLFAIRGTRVLGGLAVLLMLPGSNVVCPKMIERTPRSPCLGIRCLNGRCLRGAVGCNGINDCGDNSDEQNCTAYNELKRCTNSGRGSWIAGESFCYNIVYGWESFHSAQRLCLGMNSQLVSIACEDEFQLLVNAISALALRDGFFAYSAYWIGLREMENGTLWWTDRTPVTYLNFKVGEPNNAHESCVEMYGREIMGLEWNDDSCDAANKGYICKAPAGIIITEGKSQTCRRAVTTTLRPTLTTTENLRLTSTAGRTEFGNSSMNEESSTRSFYVETAFTAMYVVGGVILAALVIAGISYGIWRHHKFHGSARQASSEYSALGLLAARSVADGRNGNGQHEYECIDKI